MGLSVNAVGKVYESPLHICAVSGSRRMASLLLQHGADALSMDGEGWCPIHYAARFGDRAVLDTLIQARPAGSPSSHPSRASAASTDKEDPAQSPSSSGSDPTEDDAPLEAASATVATKEEGWTALHIATLFEQVPPRRRGPVLWPGPPCAVGPRAPPQDASRSVPPADQSAAREPPRIAGEAG